MNNKNYIIPNITKDFLMKNKFRYNSFLSTKEETIYTYIFPVYKQRDISVLTCEFILLAETGELRIKVYNSITKENYVPFYYCEYGKNILLEQINKNIRKELKKIGATHEKHKH